MVLSRRLQREAEAHLQGSIWLREDSKRLVEGCGKATAFPAFDLLGYEASTALLVHLKLTFYFHSETSEIKDFTLLSQLTWVQVANV